MVVIFIQLLDRRGLGNDGRHAGKAHNLLELVYENIRESLEIII